MAQSKMVPLSDYVAKNPEMNLGNMEYMFQRCAGFYTTMIVLMKDNKNSRNIEIRNLAATKLGIASGNAIKLMEKRFGGSIDGLTATLIDIVKEMAMEYQKEGNRHYTLTGNYLIGNLLLTGDGAICAEITKN